MNYPQIKGKITHSELVGPLYRGLSHTPQRYAAKGARSDSPYPGLFSGGSDLTVGESLSASIVGGWLVANAVTGYGPLDHLFLQKNITKRKKKTNPMIHQSLRKKFKNIFLF